MAFRSKDEFKHEIERAFAAKDLGRVRLLSAQALAEWRPMDSGGARLVLEGQAELAGMLDDGRARPLLDWLERLAGKRDCLQCGTCCRTSSPTLYAEDLARIGGSGIPPNRLYTLRSGELAWSPRLNRLQRLDRELIKLAEDANRACIFLKGAGCRIYEQRPLQCRHLQCWDARHAGGLAGHKRLNRRDIFKDDQTALALIDEYEHKLPADRASRALQDCARGGPDSEALQMLELDHRLRWGISRRYGYAPDILPLLLGRPLSEWLVSFGLELVLDEDQQPRLMGK